jgi:putative holliday junction resolvase
VPVTAGLPAFAALLPARGSLLAIDASKRRLGLAGTDPGRSLVTPLLTLARGRWAEDAARLARVAREREVGGLVVGLPLNMDGSEGPMAQAARALAANLDAALGLPVHLQDERLTTFAVRDAIEEGRLPRPKRPGEPLDHYAAAVILEDCLRALAALLPR